MHPQSVRSIFLSGILLMLSAFFSLACAQGGDAFPFNRLHPEEVDAIEVNGVSLSDLHGSEGDEGVIAALCECPYTVLKSEDPDLPWAAYTLFDGEYRLSISFSPLESGSMGIAHLDLLGSRATLTLNGVILSKGDTMDKLGTVKSRRQFSGGLLHFALFPGGAPDTFLHIGFEPETREIRKIGYIAPF